MSQSTHPARAEAPPFSPLFSPSQESSPPRSLHSSSPSPSPTPLAHRTHSHQQPGPLHRPPRPSLSRPQPASSLSESRSAAALARPIAAAWAGGDEDVDVLLSPSFSLPLSNSDNSAPHSPAQSPFPASPALSSSGSSASASSSGPAALCGWQLAYFHARYPHLSQLNLSHNRLTSLCSFHSVAHSLRTLSLAYNLLPSSSLPHLASLTELEVLSLAHNNIDSLSSLPPLPALASLDLSSNCLSLAQHSLIQPLSRALPALQRLALSGNPFCSADADYRLKVIDGVRQCRQLTWLDGLPVEEERRGLGLAAGLADSAVAAGEERKEQLGPGEGDGGERHRGPHGTAKRIDNSVDEADSKYDTSAVPFAPISPLLFSSPFTTPQPRPASAAVSVRPSRVLSVAPVAHHDLDSTTARPDAALTGTPLAPLQPPSSAHGSSADIAAMTVIASPLPHSTSRPALSPHRSAIAARQATLLPAQLPTTVTEQEARIAALEDELNKMRRQLLDSAVSTSTTQRHETNAPQHPIDTAHLAALPDKPAFASSLTRSFQQHNDASSVMSSSPAASPPQLPLPPVSSSSSSASSSSSPTSHSSLLFDLQLSRRQCDDLRAQLAGLQHVVALHEQTISARLSVDTDGLSLWRHAVVQLVKKQKEDEEQRQRAAEERTDADRRWCQEREQRAAELEVLRRTAERAREEVWKREDELSRMRVQLSQSEARLEQSEHEMARQSLQLQEACTGLAALRASQQSVGAAYERAERMLAATAARLHFACQRVAVIQQLHVIDSGGRESGEVRAASVQLSCAVSPSRATSVLSSHQVALSDDSSILKRELGRLRHDNGVLLQRHAAAVSQLRSEHAKAAAEHAARTEAAAEQLSALRVQCQTAADDNARLSAELTEARSALSRHQADLVDALDSVRREGERQADERCERLRADLKKARDEHAALQREAVAGALELRRMQRVLNKLQEDSGRAEDDRWRAAEDELRRRDQRIERLERDKEELSRRWRQMLPQSIAAQQHATTSGSSSSSGSGGMTGSANGAGTHGPAGNAAVSAKLSSLAALSMQLLEDDSDD